MSPAATTVFLSTPTIFEATRLGTTSSSNAFPSHINAAHFRSVYLDAKENVANEHEDAEQPSDTSSEEIEWKEPKSDFDFQRENGGGSSESTVEEYDDDKTTLMAAEKTDGETVEPLMGLSPGVGMGCEIPSGEKKCRALILFLRRRRSLPFHCYADHVESKLDKKPGARFLSLSFCLSNLF